MTPPLAQSARQRAFFRTKFGQNASRGEQVPRESGVFKSAARQPWETTPTGVTPGLVARLMLGGFAACGLLAGVISHLVR